MMLRKYLLQTLVYYDCLDYPLTPFEVWKHLMVYGERVQVAPPSLAAVLEGLGTLVDEKKVFCMYGLYALLGREMIIENRLREEKISVQKLKRVKKLIAWLAWIPFIRMIGITGSLAMKKSEPRSDWDFFVVVRAGHIWLGRTLLTFILQLLGKRRHGRYIENRACLNYYLADDALEISPKDLFSAHEYRFLIPILDYGIFRRFEIANRWIAEMKPNFRVTEIASHWQLPLRKWPYVFQQWLEFLLGRLDLEPWLSRWQRRKIALNPNTQKPGSFIEASDRALIFLPQPKGPKIFERFKIRLSESHG